MVCLPEPAGHEVCDRGCDAGLDDVDHSSPVAAAPISTGRTGGRVHPANGRDTIGLTEVRSVPINAHVRAPRADLNPTPQSEPLLARATRDIFRAYSWRLGTLWCSLWRRRGCIVT